jgi:hypothetical protein
MGTAPGGGMSTRLCLTKEMVERDGIPASQGDCKTTRRQRSGNTLSMAFSCSKPPSSGASQVIFQGPESYTMKTTATTTVDGKPERMTSEGTGKWLSADCGNLRPPAAPRRAEQRLRPRMLTIRWKGGRRHGACRTPRVVNGAPSASRILPSCPGCRRRAGRASRSRC